jgi:hypothetical protein
MATAKPTIYLLRDIPRESWLRARGRALLEGLTMREVILSLVAQYAAGSIDAKAGRSTRRKRKSL